MPQNFLTCDRDQPMLLPPDLRDWIDEDDLAWFVIDAIDELDHRGWSRVPDTYGLAERKHRTAAS